LNSEDRDNVEKRKSAIGKFFLISSKAQLDKIVTYEKEMYVLEAKK